MPRDNINVSDEHPLKEAAILIVGLGVAFALLALVLIFLVDLLLLAVSPEREARLFSGWVPDGIVRSEAPDSRQPSLEALLQRLEIHWTDREYELRILVSDDDAPNALALPGGLIVVTAGLLDAMESENELAFVLGHEMGHFRNRDHLRGLGRGVVFGIFVAAISAGNGGADAGVAAADLTLRRFSREQENDADRFGLEVVGAEYGHAADSWRFFEKLGDRQGAPSQLTGYLSTHPAPQDRISDIQAYARNNGWSTHGPVTPLPWSARSQD